MSSFNNSAYEPLKTLFPIWPLFETSSWLKFNISATLQQPPCHNEKIKPCTRLNEQQHWFGKQNRVEWLSGRIIPQKKISYRRESFIHLNQGLFYENLLWSSLWAGKVIASKFKIFVMKMSECARLSVAAMVCVNLVALSSKNWSQIKHLSLLKFTGITDISYHLCKDNQLLSLERYQGSPCFQVRRLIYHNGDRQPMAKQLPE